MTHLTPIETKEALKEAIKEWLDEKFSEFGWWTAKAMFAAVFAAGVYFILQQNGWHKP